MYIILSYRMYRIIDPIYQSESLCTYLCTSENNSVRLTIVRGVFCVRYIIILHKVLILHNNIIMYIHTYILHFLSVAVAIAPALTSHLVSDMALHRKSPMPASRSTSSPFRNTIRQGNVLIANCMRRSGASSEFTCTNRHSL